MQKDIAARDAALTCVNPCDANATPPTGRL
jgi:hypothetical protein